MKLELVLKSFVAGICGSVAHSLLMYAKSATGLLATFQPYEDLQKLLAQIVGGNMPAWAPWALSFVNGAVVLGFLFGRVYRFLPFKTGVLKGVVFGFLCWVAMSLLFFPALGEGLFATKVGLGVKPALFSLAMLLTYSMTLGATYAVLLSLAFGSPPVTTSHADSKPMDQ